VHDLLPVGHHLELGFVPCLIQHVQVEEEAYRVFGLIVLLYPKHGQAEFHWDYCFSL